MITITFTPETPAQADIVAKLMGAYLNAGDATPVADPETAAVETPKAEAPKKSRAKAAPAATPEAAAPAEQSPSTSAPAETAEGNDSPAATPAAASTTASTASSQDSTVTLEQVRAKLSALSQAGKAAAVKGLIAQFGVMKLTDVPAEKFGKLLEEATALEAAE